MNNATNYLRGQSPDMDEPPQVEIVPFALKDFYGSHEDTLQVTVKVYPNNHYTHNEILTASILNALGNLEDVKPFLTENQKHDIRLEAHNETR